MSDFVSFNDSFGCRIELSGRALKDLVLNYPYVSDVTEYETSVYTNIATGTEQDIEVSIEPPNADSPVVCVIDSGIQEGHFLLAPAVDASTSKSFLPGNPSTADEVPNGGHGTGVAGAVLYGNVIPKNGVQKLDVWLRNARILNERNNMPVELFPPQLMNEIAQCFDECMIFNLSVTGNRSSRLIHMSKWATAIDQIMHRDNKLFVVASGNISRISGNPSNPGIIEHLAAGRNYPAYFLEKSARIADPSQSCFALTVGSVCNGDFEDNDRRSFGKKYEPSSFTRRGPGIWRMIKPDVVEYGGDYVREKAGRNVMQLPETSVEVVQRTAGGSNAVGFAIGSSFATPKVSNVAARVLKNVPSASANLVRALVIQSARLPVANAMSPDKDIICHFGYGIPNAERASQNTESRVTLVAESRIAPKEAQIYTVKVPPEIRRPGNEYDVLMEVTLTFTAEPRRTRRRTNSYLSAWADWQSSYLNEPYERFKSRVTKYVDSSEEAEQNSALDGDETIRWCIRENVNWGTVKGMRRQDSSAQKDWAIIKAYNLPEELSIAVVGHKGWEKDITKTIPFSLVVSFEVMNAEVNIYDLIRIENVVEVRVEV